MERILVHAFNTLVVLSCILLVSCGLHKPIIQSYESMDSYKYVYITPTAGLTSSSGVYGNQYGVYGGISKSVNPTDLISGALIKRGFIRLPEVKPELVDETLIVNYGESGRRVVNLGYAIEVSIQFLSAKTNRPVCVCTAEGQGSTEADDIRKAINKALDQLFK